MPFKALKIDASSVEVDGHKVQCLLCRHPTFQQRKSHLDMALVHSMNPDWVNREAYCLVCDHCGFIHWFLSR